jgi:geranylgeranyl reductase family protein
MRYDVVVVGAGPAGSAAAEACAGYGLSTLCIEEHGTIGYPVQCAGLLSNSAFAECRTSEGPVLNRVSGAKLVSGAGSEIMIDAKVRKAWVVDRAALDREMAKSAANAGAEFRLKTSVCDVVGDTVRTRGMYGHEEIGFKILIAADGPRSTIARRYGLERAKVYLSGIQADIPCPFDQRYVGVYPDASPDFFGWAIPLGEGRTRIGLCGRYGVPERFAAFARTFGQSSSTHLVTGTLPLGLMNRTYARRTLFVGDAAGFAKPTSGGGVYTGVRSARHAAAVAADCCENDRFADRDLALYEKRWRGDLGKELEFGYRLFTLRQKMSPAQIDSLIRALDDPEILRTIVDRADMDRPVTIASILLRKPAVLACMGSLISSGIRSLFF